jgi:hypothetical protein
MILQIYGKTGGILQSRTIGDLRQKAIWLRDVLLFNEGDDGGGKSLDDLDLDEI